MRNITAMRLSSLLLGALAATWTVARPGHDVQQEAAERRAFLQNSPRDLSHCAGKLKARGHEARSIERRAQRVSQLAKNGILKGKYLCTECSGGGGGREKRKKKKKEKKKKEKKLFFCF